MPDFPYHLARAHGASMRAIYRAALPALVRRRVEPSAAMPFQVFSYSNEEMLPEQIASIRSFIRHAGRPRRFTVVSDGTHSPASIELLRSIDESVVVSSAADWVPANVPAEMRPYLSEHPTGRQLALIMSLPVNGPAFYVDADVLFFESARELQQLAASNGVPAMYLQDCEFSGDDRLLRNPEEREDPVNTGVLLLFKALDWSASIERFLQLQGTPGFFTNQTLTHLAMHANGAAPLDPAKFVLQRDDQTLYADRYASERLALRHYVNPIRHKFWTTLCRQ